MSLCQVPAVRDVAAVGEQVGGLLPAALVAVEAGELGGGYDRVLVGCVAGQVAEPQPPRRPLALGAGPVAGQLQRRGDEALQVERLGSFLQLVEHPAARPGGFERILGATCHRVEQRQETGEHRLQHAVVAVCLAQLLAAADPLRDRRRANAEPRAERCDVSPAGDLVAGGIRVGERPLVCGEALADTALAGEGQAEQPLGVGESRLVAELPERLDRLLGEPLHLHRVPVRVRPPPLQPELDLQARRQPSFAETGGGLDALLQQRLGLRTPPRLEQRVAELALDTRTLARVGDAELERSLEPGGALGEGPGCEGRRPARRL